MAFILPTHVTFPDRRRSLTVTSLYVSLNGKLYLVLAGGARGYGTIIDGYAASTIVIGPKSLQGNSIVFSLTRYGVGKEQVYRADFTP